MATLVSILRQHGPAYRQKFDLQASPCAWTTEALWRAYTQLERDKVREVRAPRVLQQVLGNLGGELPRQHARYLPVGKLDGSHEDG